MPLTPEKVWRALRRALAPCAASESRVQLAVLASILLPALFLAELPRWPRAAVALAQPPLRRLLPPQPPRPSSSRRVAGRGQPRRRAVQRRRSSARSRSRSPRRTPLPAPSAPVEPIQSAPVARPLAAPATSTAAPRRKADRPAPASPSAEAVDVGSLAKYRASVNPGRAIQALSARGDRQQLGGRGGGAHGDRRRRPHFALQRAPKLGPRDPRPAGARHVQERQALRADAARAAREGVRGRAARDLQPQRIRARAETRRRGRRRGGCRCARRARGCDGSAPATAPCAPLARRSV